MRRTVQTLLALLTIAGTSGLVAGPVLAQSTATTTSPAAATTTTTTPKVVKAKGITRTILAETEPINAPGQTLYLQRVVIDPKTALSEHYHEGTQVARVVRGTLTLQVVSGTVTVTDRKGVTTDVNGPAEVVLRAGESVTEVPPVVHYGENRTDAKVVLEVAALLAIGEPLATPTGAPAGATITLTTEIASTQAILNKEVPSVTYGWNHLVGTASLAGQPVLCDMLGNVNYLNGDGPFFGFVTFTFADGSQIATQMLGRADQKPDGSSTVVATLGIFGGTGRYAGATGSGTFVGERSSAVGAPVQSTFVLSPKVG